MNENNKKKPLKFSIDFEKEWNNSTTYKLSYVSNAFKLIEKEYLKNTKYSSLHELYKVNKPEAKISFEKIHELTKAIELIESYGLRIEVEDVKKVKKKTKPITGRTQRTTNTILKIQKEYNELVHMKGLQPRKAKELLAKKFKLKVSTINTYLNENPYFSKDKTTR